MSVTDDLVRVRLVLEGLPPGLLFQSKGLMIEDEGKTKRPNRSKEEEARLHGHWMKSGKKDVLCIPWVMFYRSFIQAAGGFKLPSNKKKFMSGYVASTVSCEVDKISLGTDKFEVCDEFVRIPPRTGALVRIGRPLIREWKVTLVMIVDAEDYGAEILEPIIKESGKNVGIAAWSPRLKGPHGKFLLREFRIL